MSIVATIWNFIVKQASAFKFVIERQGAWNFVTKQINRWRFVITRQNEWRFKIKILTPNDVWILGDGTWNDDKFWIDTALWKDS